MFSQEVQWLLVEKYAGQKSTAFLADVARLEAGEPLAYLIGHIPFLNTTIWLDSKPLIPRSETEYWVEKVIGEIKNCQEKSSDPLRVLDLCAGSGCVGVAIAKAIPSVFVDFIEVENIHIPTIRKNCQQNGLAESHYKIYSGNLFSVENAASLDNYDFIVSNPPYIDPVIDRAESSVKKFEPTVALYGGTAGMEIIERIISESPKHLTSHGQLWLEHEPEQAELISKFAQSRFITTSLKDQFQNIRFSKLVLQ